MPCGVPQAADIPVTSSGRMSPEPFPAIMDRTFCACLKKSDRPAFQCLSLTSGQKPVWSNYQSARLPGASSTPSIGACPSVARIFLVADFGTKERRAAEMLFVAAGLQRNPCQSREADRKTAPTGTTDGTRETGSTPVTPAYADTYAMRRSDHIIKSDLATCLAARDYKGIQTLVNYPRGKLASGRDCTGTLCANASTKQWMGNQEAFSGDYFLIENETAEDARTVRRLTVTECERLQGLPDGWTDVPVDGRPARESERIKAIGNGMAQPCADFILRQLAFYHRPDSQ